MKKKYALGSIALIIFLDQIIKLAVISKMNIGVSIGKLIRITNAANTGMAYSIRQE